MSPRTATGRRPGRRGLRSALHDLVASGAELEASEAQRFTRAQGCAAVAELPDRSQGAASGVLRSVTLRARETVPALEADLYDGSGSVRLVWLGRRRIAGVEPGRHLRAEGFVCTQEGVPTMFNPRYELLAETRG